MSNVADDAFGRWLEERIAAWREIGVEAERNRIIKLLESVQTMFETSVDSPQKELMDGILNQVTQYLVKEIKGEN